MTWNMVLVMLLIAGAGVASRGCAPGSVPGQIETQEKPRPPVVPSAAAVVEQPAPAVPMITVTGRFTYTDLALPVAADGSVGDRVTTIKPVRFADVVVLDNNSALIGTATSTDADGNVAFQVPFDTPFRPALVTRTVVSGRSAVDVRDLAGQVYMVPFTLPTGEPNVVPTGTATFRINFSPIPATNGSLGGAFNILDAAIVGSDRVFALTGALTPPISFLWEPRSRTGSFFNSQGLNGMPAITIKGGNSDLDNTDEFDDAVILHELGHFVTFTYSRDSTRGGPHALNDITNPPLAWNEGFSTFFSGLASNLPVYADAQMITSQTVSPTFFTIDLEGGRSALRTHGIRSEETVGEVLWDLCDGTEGRPDRDGDPSVLTAQQIFTPYRALRAQPLYVTINDYLNQLVATNTISAANLVGLLAAPDNQMISFPAAGDSRPPPFGVGGDIVPAPIAFNAPVSDRCVTRTESIFDENETADESNRFFVLDTGGLIGSLTVSLQLQAPALGTNATGTNIDAVLLTIDNQFARDVDGSPFSSFFPSPEANVEVATKRVPPGKYIVWVHGRPNLGGDLSNTTTNNVTFTLICGFAP